MKTSAIANLPNTSGTSSTAKSDASPETSFGQVLSREVGNRSNVNESNTSRANEGRSDSQGTQTASPATNANKAPSAKEENTVPPAKDASAAAKGGEADSAGGLPEDDETTVAAVSAELLALVANLNQAAVPTNGRPGQSADGETAPSGVTAALGGMPTAGITDASLADEAAPAITAEESHVQPGDFNAALTQAQDGKSASQEGVAQVDTPRARFLAAAQSASEAQTSKAAQDALSAAAPAVDNAAMSSAQMQQAQAAINDTANRLASLGDNPGGNQALKQAQDIPAVAASVNVAAMSQAQMQQVQSAAGETANHLAPRVGTPNWDQALGQKVVWMASNAQQSASLILNPPDLGPLQVVLNVSNNEATAQFTAAQPEVRQALEASLPKLREMLGEAGIQLGEANVSAGMPNNQQNTHGQQSKSSHEIDQKGGDIANAPVQITSSKVITGRQGLVDTFA